MNRYPTDEELNRFIEKLEKEELYAPKHLKEEILLRAKETKKTGPSSFLMYTLKMAAGMAAAVFLVFMIPVNDGSNISRADSSNREWNGFREKDPEEVEYSPSLDERIGIRLDEKKEETDKFFEKINSLFQMDIGGNDYES